MVEWGMPPLDALRAATANGAELLRPPGRRHDRGGQASRSAARRRRSRGGPARAAGSEKRVAGRRLRLAILEDPLQDLDALAQGGEFGGGEVGEPCSARSRRVWHDPVAASAHRSASRGPGPPSRHPGRPPGPRVRPGRARPRASSSWAVRPARRARARRSASGRRTPGPRGRRGAGQRCPAPRPPRAGAARGGSRPSGAGPPTRPTSRVGEVRLDVVIGISLGYLNITRRQARWQAPRKSSSRRSRRVT